MMDALIIIAILALIVVAEFVMLLMTNGQLSRAHATIAYDAETIKFLKAEVAKMDGDGNGKVGGSRPRA